MKISNHNMFGASIFDYVWTFRSLSTEEQDRKKREFFATSIILFILSLISYFSLHFFISATFLVGLVKLFQIVTFSSSVILFIFSTRYGLDIILYALIAINLKREQLIGKEHSWFCLALFFLCLIYSIMHFLFTF